MTLPTLLLLGQRLLTGLTIALSSAAMLLYLWVAGARAGYPFAVEWVEANTFLHVLRVTQGQPIFVAPGYEFIPMIYTPLYYYVAALLAWPSGNIMLALRLVSICSSLAAFGALYAIGRAMQLRSSVALLGSGLFAASYPVAGYWFDIGRVDMLFLALLLLAQWLIVRSSKQQRLSGLLAALVLWLSFATKQQAVIAYPCWLLYLLIQRRWWQAASFGLGFGILLAGALGLGNAVTQGWLWFYIYTLPAAAPHTPGALQSFWSQQLMPYYRPLFGLILLGLAWRLAQQQRRQLLGRALGLLLLVAPLLAMSYLSLAKQWGYLNGLLPALAGLALLGAEGLQALLTQHARWRRGQPVLYGLALLLLVAQFVELGYDPRPQIPTAANHAAGVSLVERLRQVPGPIFAPTAPHLLYLAGRPTHSHSSSLGDLQLAAQYNPRARTVFERLAPQLTARLAGVQTALLPNARWYDSIFSPEHGYSCESMEQGQPLTTVTGAISWLAKICIGR